MLFAIKYVLGAETHVYVTDAPNADEAYADIREILRLKGFVTASLQGTCRPALQEEIDATVAELRGEIEHLTSLIDGVRCSNTRMENWQHRKYWERKDRRAFAERELASMTGGRDAK